MSDNTQIMQKALALAQLPVHSPSPNPRVGALVIRDGHVVGQGWHPGPGQEHAEETALREAGEAAAGSTLFCTLEPCSHSGGGKHRPPCAPLIVRAGVSRVVIGQLDPNPRVRGRGAQILRDAGIAVEIGVLQQQSILLNPGFNTMMALGRPFVHCKVATSLDGRLASGDGGSSWITGSAARDWTHAQRGAADAVLVGIGTVLADDPLLTARSGPERHPRAVVLDSRARIPLESALVRRRAAETLLIAGPNAPHERVAALERVGVRVRLSEAVGEAAGVLEILANEGILSVFVEGGAAVLRSFLRADLFDRLTVAIAPVLLGGHSLALDPPPAPTMDRAMRLASSRTIAVDPDVIVDGYRPGWLEAVHCAMDAGCSMDLEEDAHVHRAG